MAETYEKIFRQVVLRANQLAADDTSALAASYVTSAIGDTQMADRAIEFPAMAINDAILNAGDRLVGAIGMDPYSPYRRFFAGVTANLATGSELPLLDSGNKTVVGVIGDVRDATSFKKLVSRNYQAVIGVSNLALLKQSVHWYYTDNVRIWHTRDNVICDVVVWDKADQLTLLTTNPRGNCPFPQELHEALVCGALSYIFRSTFNIEQVMIWRRYFEAVIARLEQGKMVGETVLRQESE